MNKISLNWSIMAKHREARSGDTLILVTNGRVSTFGPCRWAIFLTDGDDRCLMAEGEVFTGGRYQSLEREAMFIAEQRAILEGWVQA